MHLYQLSQDYRVLSEALEADELQEDALKQQLAGIKTQFQDKAVNIGKLVLSLESDSSVIETEITRLSKRLSTVKNRSEWLKSYLLNEMCVAGVDKVKGDVLNVSLRTNPPSVQIINQEEIPQEFRREIPARWEPAKTLILNHFKSTGEIISGCDIVRDRKSIVIK
jgi:hypothetical protein